MFPFCNQADLRDRGAVVCREARHWDNEGHEQTQIRTGAYECPRCRLWWPLIESPDEWTLNQETGKWDAISWWGGAVCGECNLLMINQPDGTTKAYELGQ
jgi:hypothetical protein